MTAAREERAASGVDTTFDVRSDAGVDAQGAGRDPDRYSRTLQRFHRLLWSKPLPDGGPFKLVNSPRGAALIARTADGDLVLASDSIVHTLRSFRGAQPLIAQLPPDELDAFLRIICTIGGYTLFPADRIDGKQTINQARGMHPAIRDRFDLTLECIRRYYAGLDSPLTAVLGRFSGFFGLFGTFRGYVEFFLLQDLVKPNGDAIRFWTGTEEAPDAALPTSVEAYRAYRDRSTAFVLARNARIEEATRP